MASFDTVDRGLIKMKIRILCVLFSVITLVLCACGGKSESGSQASASPDSASKASPDTPITTVEPTTEHYLDQSEAAAHKVELLVTKPLKSKSKKLDVKELLQNPELPTGCESVALTAALRYLGYNIDKTEIADNYLIYDEDIFWGFAGDPYSDDGAGIYPPGMTNTANYFFELNGEKHSAVNTMGYSLEKLYRLIDNGYPVLVWTTMDFWEPNVIDTGYYFGDEEYFWYDNEHCIVLTGYDLNSKTLTFCDPLEGIVTCVEDEFEAIYNEIGKLSMTIVEAEKQ